MQIVFCKILFLFALFTSSPALCSEEIFNYWKKGRFNQAIDLCLKSNQNLLARTIQASRLLDPFYQGHYCSAATDFLKKNPLWVQRTAMIKKGERLMQRWTARDRILWCQKYPPVSSKGKKLYLEAFVKQFGLTSNAVPLIRKCWIHCSFSEFEIQEYLKRYGRFLSFVDHQDRLTSLIMAEDIEGIKLLMPLLDSTQRNKAEMCILLLQHNNTVCRTFFLDQKCQLDRDLAYAFFKCHRQDRLMPKKSVILLSNFLISFNNSKEDCHLSQWTEVINIVSRELLIYKEYERAYKVVSTSFRGSSFLSGWIALNFLRHPKLALGHFLKMNNLAKSPHNRAKSYYWIAQSLLKMNKVEEAKIAFSRAGFFYSTFYGQLSLLELNRKHFCCLDFPSVKKPLKCNQEMLKVICLLKHYGRYDIARPMCKALFARLTRPEILFSLDLLAINNGPQASYWNCVIGELASERGVFVAKYLYPRLDCLPLMSLTESCLLHAIVKQESGFNPRAVSDANAFGLMQILPNTVSRIATKLGISVESLLDPQTNLTLGNAYLQELFRRYRGNNILTLAAYNAGPSNVFQWKKNNGAPNSGGTIALAVEWIEKIPFLSTSRYVEAVIANKVVYQALFSGNLEISLHKELNCLGTRN